MSKWKGKRLQLPKEMHSTIMSHLPAYFKQRIKDHIFQTHMLMAEFNVHVQTNEALEAELKEIIDQYDSNNNTSKRSIVGIELDMDGEFVLSVHRNEPADRFNRTPYKTTKTHSRAVEKKEPPQKKPPQKTQKKGFMKTAPAITPTKVVKPKGNGQFVDDGLSSLFAEEEAAPISKPPVNKEIKAEKPVAEIEETIEENPIINSESTKQAKVRLRFGDTQKPKTTTGKLGSGSLESLLQDDMKRFAGKRPWEDD